MAAPTPALAAATSGPGALCPEAQADGVPCAELGVDCLVCGRAAPDLPALDSSVDVTAQDSCAGGGGVQRPAGRRVRG
jgi:hypothetical protein